MKRVNRSDKKIKELESAQKAILNLLDDLEKERNFLRVAKARDEAIMESMGDGLVVTDVNMRVILINKSAEKATGWSSKDVLNRVWPEVIMTETEDDRKLPVNKSPCFLAIHTQKTTAGDYYYTRKDRTKFPVAITASSFKIKNKLLGAVIVFHDVTREREIDKMQNEFISMASHQLRTPLSSIQWVIERILKKEKLTIGMQGYLQDIYVSVQRLSSLVNDLLDTARFYKDGLDISPKQIELVAFIRDFIAECTPLYIKKRIVLTFEKHPKTLNIITDLNFLQNVIQSLVHNAIEYTPEQGKVMIFLERKDGYFLLRISDTGIGIPKQEQATIFNKFTRGSNAKLIKTNGTGLGLYTAKQAINLLQGKIWFKSKKNKGTTFYLRLPIKSRSKRGTKEIESLHKKI